MALNPITREPNEPAREYAIRLRRRAATHAILAKWAAADGHHRAAARARRMVDSLRREADELETCEA